MYCIFTWFFRYFGYFFVLWSLMKHFIVAIICFCIGLSLENEKLIYRNTETLQTQLQITQKCKLKIYIQTWIYFDMNDIIINFHTQTQIDVITVIQKEHGVDELTNFDISFMTCYATNHKLSRNLFVC